MKPFRRPLLAIIAPLLVLSGCSLLPAPDTRPVHYYRLEPPSSPVRAGERRPVVVELGPVRVFPAYATSRIAYRNEGDALGYHVYHRWVDTPARQLLPLLADALERSGCCAAVVLPGSGVRVDERLEIDLLRFEIDYRASPAVFRLTARLQRIDPRRRRVRASERLTVAEPLEGSGPAAGAAAASRAAAALAARAVALVGKGEE